MSLLRTRFKKEIVSEFSPPAKRKDWQKGRILIFCEGMPTVPYKRPLLDFFSKKGFWVFHPRYRGSWESGGKFLKGSPEKDILDVVDSLSRGFRDLWSGKRYKVRPKSVYLLASSFGGPAGILLSRDPRITKVIAVSPVIDWRAVSKAESLGFVARFAKKAFGNAYRFSMKDWNKLRTGKFYSPKARQKEIVGKKIFIIHAKDDDSVLFGPVRSFAKAVGAEFLALQEGGHGILYKITRPNIYRRIKRFFVRTV